MEREMELGVGMEVVAYRDGDQEDRDGNRGLL